MPLQQKAFASQGSKNVTRHCPGCGKHKENEDSAEEGGKTGHKVTFSLRQKGLSFKMELV